MMSVYNRTDTTNIFVKMRKKGHLIQAPYCNTPVCEEKIKELSAQGLDVEAGAPSMGAKALCTPFKPIRPFDSGTGVTVIHVLSRN